jgi:arginine deiminase
MKYGCQSETGPIKSIILKHPKDAFYNQEYVNANWKDLNYIGCPDYESVVKEYDAFAALLKKEVSDIHFLPKNSKTGMDSIYTHDPALITENGAILCNMGKKQRQGESSAIGQYLTGLDIPILGSISGSGKLEGGDVVWLDKRTLAVGLTYRTNAEGIRQLKELTADIVEDIIPVPLPHWNGENDCFHLMSIISPVDNDLAVVYSRLMPVFFREMLVARGIRLIEVPDAEYGSMGCNVLAIAPRKCIVISGNPLTKKMLKKSGAEVSDFNGENLCLKGGGGPTCLTRPTLRAY